MAVITWAIGELFIRPPQTNPHEFECRTRSTACTPEHQGHMHRSFTKKGGNSAEPLKLLISKGLPLSGTLAEWFGSARRLDSMGLGPLAGWKRPFDKLRAAFGRPVA